MILINFENFFEQNIQNKFVNLIFIKHILSYNTSNHNIIVLKSYSNSICIKKKNVLGNFLISKKAKDAF